MFDILRFQLRERRNGQRKYKRNFTTDWPPGGHQFSSTYYIPVLHTQIQS